MEQHEPTEFILEAFTDPRSVRDVVKGILHTIFFNRFFPSLTPQTHEVLDLTLPYVDDDELETMIDQRVSAFERHLDTERNSAHHAATGAGVGFGGGGDDRLDGFSAGGGGFGGRVGGVSGIPGAGGRGQLAVQFFEKRRRKAWLSRGDDEVCWECWTVKVIVAEPRTESERAKVRKAMEQTLLATAMKIVTFANTHKDHIPPITTQATNPFPYKIQIEQKETGWANRMRLYT